MFSNIIFAGGALKGWAYIGTIKALHELVKKELIQTVTGVSIGALFGLLYILDIPHELILDKILNVNFIDYIDMDIENLLTNESILKGEKFKTLISELISLRIEPSITFSDLRKYSRINFNITALDIVQKEYTIFNYKNTPHVKVLDSIMASCSVPVLFPPYKIDSVLYYDGGICDNCPVSLFDEENTIGFDLFSDNISSETNFKILDLVYMLIDFSNKYHKKTERKNVYTVIDKKFNNQVFNLNQTKQEIYNIFMSGYNNSYRVIFDNYIALPPPSSSNINAIAE